VSRDRALLVLIGCLLTGCVGGSNDTGPADRDRLKAYTLDAPPTDVHALDVNFENKVHLVGYKFEPDVGSPGSEVKLTYYWRCDQTVEDGWKLFTHTKDLGSGKLGNLDLNGPLRERKEGREVLGPNRWQKGKIYVDEQTLKIPSNVVGSNIMILVGIFQGNARLRILSGPNDGDNCAIVGVVGTGVTSKAAEEHIATEPPSLTVGKLAHPDEITIDGKADEPEWKTAASTGAFVDIGTGKRNTIWPVNGSAKLLWDDKNLYVYCEVQEVNPYMGFTNAKAQPDDFTVAGQPKLWTKDTVEMMVEPDPRGDNRGYYEIQINPQNKVFKSEFDALQQPSGGPNGPFGHEDWTPKIKSAVRVFKGPSGTTGYTVEIAIPWSAYAKGANHPPKPGDVWRMNFYALKENSGVSWSPVLGKGSLHEGSRFGRVTWALPAAPASADAKPALAAPSGSAARPSPM
jgi:hypothetical protein